MGNLDSERILVAQALLHLLHLRRLHSTHSQPLKEARGKEWLCYQTYSAPLEASQRLFHLFHLPYQLPSSNFMPSIYVPIDSCECKGCLQGRILFGQNMIFPL